MTESTLLSVIGVDSRLLEPLRRGSVRGRGSGIAQRACGFTGLRLIFSHFFLRFYRCVMLGVFFRVCTCFRSFFRGSFRALFR